MDPKNPTLPNIPTKHSFAYGSQATAILPRQLVVQHKMDLTEMAATIEKGRQQAEDRAKKEAREAERSRRASLREQSLDRQSSPDQTQLLGTLQEDIESASPSPSPPLGRSTPTPTPPIPHTLSTTPDSPPHSPQPNGLYPSPLLRVGALNDLGTPLGSSPKPNSLDNDSTLISWTVERDVHDDDLQRTHPGRGSNISAPPRRISGLTVIHDTIEDEEEPIKQPSPEPLPEPEPEPVVKVPPAPPIVHQAPVRQFFPHKIQVPMPQRSWFGRTATIMLLTTLTCFTLYAFSDQLAAFSRSVCWSLPFSRPSINVPLNGSDLQAFNALTYQVDRLGEQVSTLSRDVKSVKSELANGGFDTSVRPISGHKTRSKTNFLSDALGAVVDPYTTSPTSGKQPTFIQRIYLKVTGARTRNPPITALLPWQEVGDCWCSTPQTGTGISQLGVILSRAIVPEEVVVEHIPDGASITPGVAPRKMELWARFKGEVPDSPTAPLFSWFPRFFSSSSSPPEPPLDKVRASASVPSYVYSTSGKFLLHETVMGVLRKAYRDEPENTYSDDKLLASGYYRLGRWEYDIHGRDNIQEFPLDAIIDLPDIRVDKVVVRATSNWGANETCLYRVKLLGHM